MLLCFRFKRNDVSTPCHIRITGNPHRSLHSQLTITGIYGPPIHVLEHHDLCDAVLYVTDGVVMPGMSLDSLPDTLLVDDDIPLLITNVSAVHQLLKQRAAQQQV